MSGWHHAQGFQTNGNFLQMHVFAFSEQQLSLVSDFLQKQLLHSRFQIFQCKRHSTRCTHVGQLTSKEKRNAQLEKVQDVIWRLSQLRDADYTLLTETEVGKTLPSCIMWNRGLCVLRVCRHTKSQDISPSSPYFLFFLLQVPKPYRGAKLNCIKKH